ncbi:MAG: HNH endonuclease [Gammaproteobacteria bacterium]|nr:HNH endonuclease [Gammaproteobacteria bacterium]
MSAVVAFEPDLGPSSLSEAERLGEEIAELCVYLHVAKAHLLDLIREFDERRCWEELGFPSCVAWLGFQCGIGANAAREHLRVAHALVHVPKIAERFAEGRLSYSKVRAMTRVAHAGNEEFLLMVAKHGTASHVERLVSQCRRVEKLNRPDAAQEIFEQREVTYYYDDGGCLVMKARLPAEQGELIVKALEMAMDSDEQYNAPVAARRADALSQIAETYLNHPENAGSTADRYQVIVHTRAGDSVGAAIGRDSHLENCPHVEPKAPLSAETSKRISCECCKTEITEDEAGEPLNIGRRTRTIPPAMRRALKARDGGCRFPGCTNHKFVDGHHIRHWSDGGETSLDNLVLLCRFHHHLVHEGGYDCRKSTDGEIYFVDRREQRLNEFQTSPRVSVEETLAWMYRKFDNKDVSAETSRARWYAGEEMDMEYAVWVMANTKPPGWTPYERPE